MKSYQSDLIVKLDLQYFGEFDELDIEKIEQEIEQELEENVEIEETSETEIVDEVVDEVGDENSEQPDISTDDGRNQAFAELRRERDRLAQEAAFIREFAEANNMTVEQLREQYEASRLEKEAEEKGVPVEVLKRLSTLEQENEQVKSQAQAVRFNAQVEATMAKYNGTQDDFNATIKYAQDNGMIDALKNGSITFEAAYKLANMDTLLEKAKKDAVQNDLASRKKRQQEAPIAVGTQAQATVDDDLDSLVEADVKEILADLNF